MGLLRLNNCPTTIQLANALINALRLLFEKDDMLLDANVNERTITHRLAVYLEREFPGWNVDCEYNRRGQGGCPKRLDYVIEAENVRSDDTEGRSVFPDIIVHCRGTDDNYLVIEVKKSTSTEDERKDVAKLKAFTNPDRYGYKVGLFLNIGIEQGIPTILRFVSGKNIYEPIRVISDSYNKAVLDVVEMLESFG